MTFFDDLQERTAEARQDLLETRIIRDALAGRIELPQYVAFLEQAYHHVRHTVPLLMACGSRLPERLAWLRSAVGEYIEEERGHEEWILSDIAACGADAEAVRAGKPGHETAVMVAYAYHQIDRRNPVGFFGMVHVLEGTSTAVATVAAGAIRDALRLPPNAFTYLTSHGSLDIEHVQFFASLMNQLDSENDRESVVECANTVYRLYGDVFRALPQRAHA
jgi:pyrroloquinoline quinone (PQQ) biosynthesis protein C